MKLLKLNFFIRQRFNNFNDNFKDGRNKRVRPRRDGRESIHTLMKSSVEDVQSYRRCLILLSRSGLETK